MELTVSADAARVLLALRNGEKRMGYAVSNALRSGILAAQSAVRGRVQSKFQVRPSARAFILREAAIVKPFPSPAHLETRMAVGTKPRLFLSTFEAGGPRLPAVGRRMAVPVVGGPARPTFAQSVPTSLQFRQLALRPVARGRVRRKFDPSVVRVLSGPGAERFAGAQRTFQLPATVREPEGGVFQRVGPKRADVRLVYGFRANVARLDERLRFVATAATAATVEFPAALGREVVATLQFQLARAAA